MKRWVIGLALVVAGCGASSPAPQAPSPGQSDVFTTLSNGSIGIQIGNDGMPRQMMFVASSLVGDGPDPLTTVPFPEIISARVSGASPGVTSRKNAAFHVSTSWLKPESNGMLLRVTDGKRTMDVEYTLHPTESALKMSVRVIRGTGDVALSILHRNSPLKPVEVNGQAVFRQGALTTVEDMGIGGSYERTFSLSGQAPASFPSRLRVPRVAIDGDKESAAALNGMMARLASGYRSGKSYGPFGLTDARYSGRVFWDLDVWVQPAMVFLDPETAKRAAEWRLSCLPQAKKNYDAWVRAGRPVSDKKHLSDINPAGLQQPAEMITGGGAMFAWEAAMSGQELSTAPTRFEHHLTGSVCLGLRFAERAGLVGSQSVAQVSSAANRFYLERSSGGVRWQNWASQTSQQPGKVYPPWEIQSVVSPDEWHVVDNDLYTNSLATWLSQVDSVPSRQYLLPRDKVTYLAFDGDEVKGYQQASALLAVWPLGSITDQTEIGKMYDRFVGKEAPQGPAMTKSLNALVAARIGRTDEALRQWNDSWRLYTDDPALRFREKQKSGEGYFYTGAAGCVNAFLYGFLGLDWTDEEPRNAVWKEKSTNGWLSLRPHLPKSWTRVEVDDIWLNGRRRHILVDHDVVSVRSQT